MDHFSVHLVAAGQDARDGWPQVGLGFLVRVPTLCLYVPAVTS